MKYDVLPLTRLIEQFERMPGIGKKSAQRLAFYVLDMPQEKAKQLAQTILEAHEKIHRCAVCQNLTDQPTCQICSDDKRDRSIICVVEGPKDVLAIERTQEYNGLYHVLHGLLSPMNGIGPDQLSIRELLSRLSDSGVREVIMATNPTVEGEATATYLARLIKPMGVRVTRLAYGIPVGGNLEYADEVTLYRAIEGRREIG
ncbi:MAG: recombination mediator RecR [Negativibacillus sp.]